MYSLDSKIVIPLYYQVQTLEVCRKVAFTSLAACLPSVPIILSVPTGLKVLYLLLKRMQTVA